MSTKSKFLRFRSGKKVNWFSHSIEFFVVVLGILFAFQLNKCSDSKSRTKLIENHRSEIKKECKLNKTNIALAESKIKNQIVNCDSLLTLISLKRAPEKIRNQSIKLLDLRNVVIVKSAYQVLLESGDIRFLEDYNTKSKIISMYDGFNEILQINKNIQNLYDAHYYPYLKKHFDLVNWNKIELNSKEDEMYYYSKELANTVSTYRFLLLAKQRIYKEQLKSIDEYLAN